MDNYRTSPTRGRPRNFDVNLAVERAMDVFWSFGYHGTSLPDLLSATELSRGSLYAAFGDKHGLFLLALDRYIDDALQRLDAELDTNRSAFAGIRACLTGYVDRTCGTNGKRGCLIVATAMELSAHDDEIQSRVTRFFKKMEARLVVAITRMKQSGDLAAGIDPACVAHLLVCFVEGFRVIGKGAPERALTQRTVDLLLDRLVI